MTTERRVRLFENGRNQAVRIPREFELHGDEAVMRKEGDRLILDPAQPIGGNDLLIAAQAFALGLAIVTDNERGFARIKDLACENWLRGATGWIRIVRDRIDLVNPAGAPMMPGGRMGCLGGNRGDRHGGCGGCGGSDRAGEPESA